MPAIPDPLWTYTFIFFSCLCGLIPYLLAWFLVIIPRKRKSLSIEILADTRLIHLDFVAPEELQIACQGDVLNNPQLILVQVTNDGDLPIPASDFEQPIRISFAAGARLLNATLIETSPALLPVAYRRDDHTLFLEPALLEKGDRIVLKLLVDGYLAPPKISAAVTGVPTINTGPRLKPPNDRYNTPEMYLRILLGLGLGMLLAGLVFFLYTLTLFKNVQDYYPLFQFTVLELIIVGGLWIAALTVVALLYAQRKRR